MPKLHEIDVTAIEGDSPHWLSESVDKPKIHEIDLNELEAGKPHWLTPQPATLAPAGSKSFEEDKHPRDDHGKFAPKGGGDESSDTPLSGRTGSYVFGKVDAGDWKIDRADYTGEKAFKFPRNYDQLSKEDQDRVMAQHDEIRKKMREWDWMQSVAVSEGLQTPEEAEARGWRHDGGHGKWQPLPKLLYHATTAITEVMKSGLKSRQELAQESGLGLGGGDDLTISFATDRDVALSIGESLKEATRVARNEITIQDMLDQATKGEGASRPFIVDIMRAGAVFAVGKDDWKVGDPLPEDWVLAMNGRERETILGETEEQIRANGGEPHGEGWMGGDGKMRYAQMTKPLDKETIDRFRFAVYNVFRAMREYAGGVMDPLFIFSDTPGLAKVPESEIGVVAAEIPDGRFGYAEGALTEWRTASARGFELSRIDKRKGEA